MYILLVVEVGILLDNGILVVNVINFLINWNYVGTSKVLDRIASIPSFDQVDLVLGIGIGDMIDDNRENYDLLLRKVVPSNDMVVCNDNFL